MWEKGHATVRVLRWVLPGGVLAAAAVSVAQGKAWGYLWGALALLAIGGPWYARRFANNDSALRLYSILFCAGLLAAAATFAVLAVTSEPDRRGAFVGLAIIWLAMAGGAIGLMVALGRRKRRSGDVVTSRSSSEGPR